MNSENLLFTDAVENIKKIKTITDEDKLKLYGLYKQAQVGDVNIECPSWFNMTARAKWTAWNELKGMKREDAEKLYIKLVDKLLRN
jgi:diazepam-binding inhibitor (GABA receptor modulating acyl-CoA-binding protein)